MGHPLRAVGSNFIRPVLWPSNTVLAVELRSRRTSEQDHCGTLAHTLYALVSLQSISQGSFLIYVYILFTLSPSKVRLADKEPISSASSLQSGNEFFVMSCAQHQPPIVYQLESPFHFSRSVCGPLFAGVYPEVSNDRDPIGRDRLDICFC